MPGADKSCLFVPGTCIFDSESSYLLDHYYDTVINYQDSLRNTASETAKGLDRGISQCNQPLTIDVSWYTHSYCRKYEIHHYFASFKNMRINTDVLFEHYVIIKLFAL